MFFSVVKALRDRDGDTNLIRECVNYEWEQRIMTFFTQFAWFFTLGILQPYSVGSIKIQASVNWKPALFSSGVVQYQLHVLPKYLNAWFNNYCLVTYSLLMHDLIKKKQQSPQIAIDILNFWQPFSAFPFLALITLHSH